MDKLNTVRKWHNTAIGFIVFGLIELAIAYGFVCLAINSGNLLWYLLTLIFFVGSIKNLFKSFGAIIHGQHKTS